MGSGQAVSPVCLAEAVPTIPPSIRSHASPAVLAAGRSVAARSNKLIGERMILNAAFLVNRRDAREFDRCVKALGDRDDKLTYKYTGPWPPYNFVNIRLKLERA